MKKLLSIIGAISLTALSGVSVVSCVIKTSAKPRFTSLLSLTSKVWNQTTKDFLASEIVADGSEQAIAKDSYLYYTILNSFKNPDEVETYFNTNNASYKASLPEPVNGQEGTNKVFLDIYLTERKTTKVANLPITTYASKTRLALSQEAKIEATLTKDQSDFIYSLLTPFTKTYARLKKEPDIPEKYILDQMYNVDLAVKNKAVEALDVKFLPSFDPELKKLYSSVGEQLDYLTKKYTDMNKAILPQLDELIKEKDGTEIRSSDIAQKITSLTLGNLTITLTNK